jgi:branched-subunit amino acid ABC-type transport system permease component
MVRASVDDINMANCVGINVPRLMTLVFGVGAFLAGVSGALGASVLGAYPGVDFDVLVLAFVVVILGGLGSLKGAFLAALLIGFLSNIGKVLFPELSMFILYAPMPIILLIKPTGLFGRL